MNGQFCFLRLLCSYGREIVGDFGMQEHVRMQEAINQSPQESMVAWPRVDVETDGQDSVRGMKEKSRSRTSLRF